jgi:glycosyltransferase involved in cell wall biosynthesis
MIETVDVIITTFNETDLLFRAVSSAKEQTYPINKIWIVDDGSEPQVVRKINEAYKSDSQVELVALEHSGVPGASRKVGVSRSSASWIAFLDADDYWNETKIEKQLLVADNRSAKFVYTNALKVGSESLGVYFPLDNFRQKLKPHHMIRVNYVINSSVMVRRELLLEVDLYADLANVRAVEDYATWLRISMNNSFFGLAEPLTFYTVSESSLSRESHIDRRPFALVDFLAWSKSKRAERLSDRFRHMSFRAGILLQLMRETLL